MECLPISMQVAARNAARPILRQIGEQYLTFCNRCGHDFVGDGGAAHCRTFPTTSRPCGASKRSEEHTSELQSLMRISYAVFCLNKKKQKHKPENDTRRASKHRKRNKGYKK